MPNWFLLLATLVAAWPIGYLIVKFLAKQPPPIAVLLACAFTFLTGMGILFNSNALATLASTAAVVLVFYLIRQENRA